MHSIHAFTQMTPELPVVPDSTYESVVSYCTEAWVFINIFTYYQLITNLLSCTRAVLQRLRRSARTPPLPGQWRTSVVDHPVHWALAHHRRTLLQRMFNKGLNE